MDAGRAINFTNALESKDTSRQVIAGGETAAGAMVVGSCAGAAVASGVGATLGGCTGALPMGGGNRGQYRLMTLGGSFQSGNACP